MLTFQRDFLVVLVAKRCFTRHLLRRLHDREFPDAAHLCAREEVTGGPHFMWDGSLSVSILTDLLDVICNSANFTSDTRLCNAFRALIAQRLAVWAELHVCRPDAEGKAATIRGMHRLNIQRSIPPLFYHL